MNFRFHPLALEELRKSALYYEELQLGLGERFVFNIESAIYAVSENPLASPELDSPVRSKLVRVFPYAILYVPFEEYFLIIAVMHLHQQPGYWQERMDDDT